MATPVDNKQEGVFKTFPEVSKLTFADRQKYEKLIAGYPPINDISFPVLMGWWSTLSNCAVSQLNGNLVIPYWMPGAEQYSGFSIIGTNNIDESICTIFDHLRAQNKPVRLVHVPEFVLASMQYPDLFVAKEERAFDEYVIPVSNFYPLQRAASFRRKRVKKFLAGVDESKIILKVLDLSVERNRQLLLDCADEWGQEKAIKLNNIAKAEAETMRTIVAHADALGVENICLFIDGELHAFSLHHYPADKRYIIGSHVRINPELPYMFDYLLYAFARWLTDQGIMYINMEYDLGIDPIRIFKLALGPTNYFRKYTIEPAKR